jgi:uncharacterized phage-associated protein
VPYEAVAVANYLIQHAKTYGEALTPMKVQKLVYFSHGWNLAIYADPLLLERFEAWKYGPVVPELYQDLKAFGAEPIPSPVQVYRVERDPHSLGAKLVTRTPDLEDYGDIDPAKQLLDRIWVVYGRYTASQLSNATHAPGSPWDITRKLTNGLPHAVIENKLIQDDFLKRAKGQAEAAKNVASNA